MGRLDDLDLSERMSTKDFDKRMPIAQRRLLQLRLHLGGQLGSGIAGPALLVVFEGPDAAGKGGAIRHIVGPLDPRHYSVSTFSAPTPEEKRRHFLWRFYRDLPGLGGMAVFDRSWYGRVLVERLEGFATVEQWSRAYDEIVQFESTLVREEMILVKFWLQISDDEQLRRFQGREADPLKNWKLTDEDWRNRKRNREYEHAAEEMFARTDHDLAPWNIIAGEQKKLARVNVIETLNARIEEGMIRSGFSVPSFADVQAPLDAPD
ncbi:MAG TPA: UDP-galactose-lipid carrier transferase [Ilumatobacteraceae bacterium]